MFEIPFLKKKKHREGPLSKEPAPVLSPEHSAPRGKVEDGIYRGEIPSNRAGFDSTDLTLQADQEKKSDSNRSIYGQPNRNLGDWQKGQVDTVPPAEETTAEQTVLLNRIKRMQSDHLESFEKSPAAEDSDGRRAA
ncbi:MAG: hypothetical protein E6Q06_02660 [Candidatus Moraniibacteriota bacterium]|nr:MAG: hypothetical protein E6Q06_02660 [Candidatus Moranbacteria bacterium]